MIEEVNRQVHAVVEDRRAKQEQWVQYLKHAPDFTHQQIAYLWIRICDVEAGLAVTMIDRFETDVMLAKWIHLGNSKEAREQQARRVAEEILRRIKEQTKIPEPPPLDQRKLM